MSLMCTYQDCLSVKYPCSKMAFFRLPNDERRSTWIMNSGNKALMDIGPKAQRFFCEKHFRECDVSSQFNRKLLRRDALLIKHHSLSASKQDSNKASISIQATKHKNKEVNTGSAESLAESNAFQSLYHEIKELDSSTNPDTAADASSDVPYRLLELYDEDNEERSTATIFVEKANEVVTKANEKHQEESLEIYLENNIDADINQVDSSTLELEDQNDLDFIETIDDDPSECALPAKKKRPNEMETHEETSVAISTNVQLPTVSNNNSYEEDKHFALSLVGYFQRLPQRKKSLAKLKILQYLTELEIDSQSSL